MPHVTFVPMTGFRVREPEMLELGMRLPGLQRRAQAIAELPALGVLTLAGITPAPWACRYQPVQSASDAAVELISADQPDLVAISALTASIEDAYLLCDQLRRRRIRTVLGGLHASVCPEEAEQHTDAVVVGRGELVWTELLQDAEDGLLRRRYVAPAAPAAEWPLPRFDLLPGTPPRFTLQTQTGCPLACGFCGASRLLGRFAEKPANRIREELQHISRIATRPAAGTGGRQHVCRNA